jgi:hypothetical protein
MKVISINNHSSVISGTQNKRYWFFYVQLLFTPTQLLRAYKYLI